MKRRSSSSRRCSVRTYCANAECGAFIPPLSNDEAKNDQVKCKECGKEMCAICNAATHQGDCPKDEATQKVLDLAKKNG